MAYQTVQNNRLAITSMVVGIVSWVIALGLMCLNYTVLAVLTVATMGLGSILYICSGLVGCLSPIGWLAAVITGHIAKSQLKASGEGGNGMATAGLVMGYLGLGLMVISICVITVLVLAGAINLNSLQNY